MSNSNKSRYKYLFMNVFAFLCGNFGAKLINFIMVPLYTNVLVPGEYGEIDLMLSIAGVLSPFIACGIHEGVMRFSLDKNSDRKLVLSIGMRVFIISSLLFLAVCPLLKYIPIISDNIVFLYLYCVLNELMTIFICYIRGKDNVKLYSFLGFMSALFTCSLNILFLVLFKWGLFGYKTSMLLSPILTTVVAAIMGNVFKDISLIKWDNKLAREILKYSLIMVPNAILWWCINASDRFLVSYMCGTGENGLYAVAYKIPTMLNAVATIFMQSWQMSAIKEHEEGVETEFYDQIYRMLTFLMGCVTLGLILVNKPILNVYVGSEYRSAWVYSPPLMVAFFIGSLGTFWGAFYIAAKDMKKYLYSAIGGAITNVILNIVLIAKLGTIGAAIATLVSYLVVLLIRALGIQRKIRTKFINTQFLSSSVCLLIGLVSAYLSTYMAWGIGVINIFVYVFVNRKQIRFLLSTINRLLNSLKLKGRE